jgi:dipeptidyl aminopeptidase/acylaminoacyl peptidase
MATTGPDRSGEAIAMNRSISTSARFLMVVAVMAGDLLICSPACGESRRLTLADLANQVGLSSPAIAPDGKHIAVVETRVNYGDNRREPSLVLVDTATGTQRVLASHSHPSSPLWSPRGDRLAWLDEDNGNPQIYVLLTNERQAHPVRITNMSLGVRNNMVRTPPFEWSRDGDSIAFITADAKEERHDEERHNKSFEVVDNDYLATEAPSSFQVWRVPVSGGEAIRLTSGQESVTGIGWLKSGSLVVASQPRPHNSSLDFAEFMNASSRMTVLKTVDPAGRNQLVIVPAPTARILSAPAPSPNGESIAYRRFRGPEPWARPNDIAIVRASGGEVRDVTSGLDRDIQEFAWLPNSKALLVSGPDRTRWALWLQPLHGPAQRLDVGPVIELSGVTVSETGAVAFVGTEAQRPSELYLMNSIHARPQRLTHFNEQIAALNLGRTETIQWRVDGFEQTGALIYPPEFTKGQKTPLVLNIHGGPEGTSTEAFSLFDQILAAQGWAVFKPNYRGSDSQGDAYQSAIIHDLGDGPGRDVMAGVAAVKARGFVDENRVAVSGWSYGGYMTTWLIGHYQGWRAAVAGAPLTNLLDWYNLSCCNVWAESVLGGSPWRNNSTAEYWRHSPVAYADKVRTPTLLLQNLGDPEVPFTQSYYFYHALRDNGVPAQLIAYPLQGHSAGTDPVNERDKYRRWIAWIDEHFRSASPNAQ